MKKIPSFFLVAFTITTYSVHAQSPLPLQDKYIDVTKTVIKTETSPPKNWSGDSAIRRVENCVCYKSIDAQNLEALDIAWDDTDKLRKQVSHCICEAHIEIQNVENPRRYLVPGTVLK